MTRKDFELIAAAVRAHLHVKRTGTDSLSVLFVEDATRGVVTTLANHLEATNPRFDRDRFIKACMREGVA
jgi:hypothetical protein